MAFPWLLSPQERLDAALARVSTAPAKITGRPRATIQDRSPANVHFAMAEQAGSAVSARRHSRTANRRRVQTAAAIAARSRAPATYRSGAVELRKRSDKGSGGGGDALMMPVRARPPTPAMGSSLDLVHEPWRSPAVRYVPASRSVHARSHTHVLAYLLAWSFR